MTPRRHPSRPQLLAAVAAAFPIGLAATVALAWAAAACLPIRAISRGAPPADTAALIDGRWHFCETTVFAGSASPLAFAQRVYSVYISDQPNAVEVAPAALALPREIRGMLAPYAEQAAKAWPITWINIQAYGWPRPALAMIDVHRMRGGAVQPGTVYEAVDIPDRLIPAGARPPWGGRHVLPTRILWTGLLLDSLLFAAPAWLLLVGRRLLRRVVRHRRGLCPACAYDVRSTPPGLPCPECGLERLA